MSSGYYVPEMQASSGPVVGYLPASDPVVVHPQDLSVPDVLKHLPQELVQSLAALSGAPDGVAELVLSTMTKAEKGLCLSYRIVALDKDESTVTLTDFGRAVVGDAAKEFTDPYGNLSTEDLSEQARAAIAELPEPSHDIRLPRKARNKYRI